jgi:hypothetical protein
MGNGYEVVYPIGRTMIKVRALAPHIPDLSGKTICGAGHSYEGDEAIAAVVELLKKQYRGIKFIPNSEFPDDVSTPEEIAAYQDMLRKKGCDVVLSGIGA